MRVENRKFGHKRKYFVEHLLRAVNDVSVVGDIVIGVGTVERKGLVENKARSVNHNTVGVTLDRELAAADVKKFVLVVKMAHGH